MTAQVGQVNIVSDDLQATIAFYRRLGIAMGEPARTSAGEPFHTNSAGAEGALLEADSSTFARAWNAGWNDEPNLAGRVLLGVHVDSRAEVDRLFAELTAVGHRGLQEPYDAFWGARFAVVEDPNGVAVGLLSPRDGPHGPPPPEFI